MTCATASVGSVYFVRWEKPEVADMRLIVRELSVLHTARRRLLTYIAVAPASSDPPDTTARKAMPSLMNDALAHCEQMYVVMEGSGFKQSLMRSVMAAVFLAGGQRGRVHVHASVEEVVRVSASSEVASAMRIFAIRGLLSGPPSGRFVAAQPAHRPIG
jgi:hypothetical protein